MRNTGRQLRELILMQKRGSNYGRYTISVIFFIAAGVFAVLAIALWFLFKIPIVIGDLSGRTAKKSIERMRLNNEKTGNKSYKTSKSNLERGKLTGTMEGMKQSD